MSVKVTNYSSQFAQKDFYITENDIGDLDLFFMYKSATEAEKTSYRIESNKASNVKIIREPIFYFSCSNHTDIKPVYQLGSKGPVGFSSGAPIYSGRIITNAFHNIPLINLLVETGVPSSKIEDLPIMDFYIVNKKRKYSKDSQRQIFQDCVIENVKFMNWNFEEGVDTPGRFFVCEFIATGFKGIHLKEYMETQLYGSKNETALTPNLIYSVSSDTNFIKNGSSDISSLDSAAAIETSLNDLIHNLKNNYERLTSSFILDFDSVLDKVNSFLEMVKDTKDEDTKKAIVDLNAARNSLSNTFSQRNANDLVLSKLNFDKAIGKFVYGDSILASNDSDIRVEFLTFNNTPVSTISSQPSVFGPLLSSLSAQYPIINKLGGVFNSSLSDIKDFVIPINCTFKVYFAKLNTTGKEDGYTGYSYGLSFDTTSEAAIVVEKNVSSDTNAAAAFKAKYPDFLNKKMEIYNSKGEPSKDLVSGEVLIDKIVESFPITDYTLYFNALYLTSNAVAFKNTYHSKFFDKKFTIVNYSSLIGFSAYAAYTPPKQVTSVVTPTFEIKTDVDYCVMSGFKIEMDGTSSGQWNVFRGFTNEEKLVVDSIKAFLDSNPTKKYKLSYVVTREYNGHECLKKDKTTSYEKLMKSTQIEKNIKGAIKGSDRITHENYSVSVQYFKKYEKAKITTTIYKSESPTGSSSPYVYKYQGNAEMSTHYYNNIFIKITEVK